MTTVVFFLWLVTTNYAAMLGAFPAPEICVQVGEKIEKDLVTRPGAVGHVVCVMSLANVNGVAAPPTAEAKPPAKPEPGSLPAAPALLKNGLLLIRE